MACWVQSALVGGAGVDGEVPAVVVVGFGDGDLHRDGVVPASRSGALRVSSSMTGVPRAWAACRASSRNAVAGQQGVAEDGVVGEPGVAFEREAAGEEGALPGGEGDGGVEQGVVGRGLAERAGVVGAAAGVSQ